MAFDIGQASLPSYVEDSPLNAYETFSWSGKQALSSTPFRVIIRLIKQKVRRHLLVLVACEVSLNDLIALEAQTT